MCRCASCGVAASPWGNLAGILAFATETSVVFLLTIYLQEVRGHSPLQTGLSFAVLGLGTVVGGLVGPRVIARLGTKAAIVGGFLVQAAATFPLIFIGEAVGWYVVLLVTTFVGGLANLVAIVGFMVTATSGLSDSDQGLATGLATMSQQVGITLGTPVMSAIATAAGAGLTSGVLHGVTTALSCERRGLRDDGPRLRCRSHRSNRVVCSYLLESAIATSEATT